MKGTDRRRNVGDTESSAYFVKKKSEKIYKNSSLSVATHNADAVFTASLAVTIARNGKLWLESTGATS